jgi:flagellar basal body-associated protein FliL
MLNALYLFIPMLIIVAAAIIMWLFEKHTYEQEIQDETTPPSDEDSEGI